MMVDDKFSIWDLMHLKSEDDEILQQHGLQSTQTGAGLADPKAIDFSGINEILKNALDALEKNETPAVDGKEGRRAVELICAIYESIKNNGTEDNFTVKDIKDVPNWNSRRSLTENK